MDGTFSRLIRAVIDGKIDVASRLLSADPGLATRAFGVGATRRHAQDFFCREIVHYVYQGDTALHVAAAAFRRSSIELLVRSGAALDAKNRRGAEPLHYAADANRWNPQAQAEAIKCLLSAGANPHAVDANGATPLHRAVRTRSAAAVRALLRGGSDVHARNKNGSTPYVLAVYDTGRGGTGSKRAREQQAAIVALLLEAGAQPVMAGR